MNARTREAIAACTRTLAGVPDADAALMLSDAVTVLPLRACADRAALRQRFRTESIDAAHRPVDATIASLYDALSDARLDAIGVHWLAGVAANLLAYPGLDDDGLRWLAFEYFSGVSAPREKTDAATRARRTLSSALLEELAAIGTFTSDEARFAEGAAVWCAKAAGQAPVPVAAAAASGFNIPVRPAGVDIRRGRYALPGQKRTDPDPPDAASEGEHTQGAKQADVDPVVALIGYRAYTTTFDRVVNAAALASGEELAALRLKLDTDFSTVRSMVARLAKRLMRVLMAKQTREWRFDLDDGLLDSSRLSAFIASGGATRPFKLEFESPFPSTVVTLLIDHSGSMKGRPMQIAALTVEIFARVLERCGVACEVLGFTTLEWDGGAPARKWADDGYPPEPGRLNALEHIVIKAADVPWRRARRGLGLSLRDETLKENIDGEALAWAHRRLLVRPERRRILVVISDGTPMDEATFAANGFEYLDGHLAAVVEHIETRSPVTLAAIGIGCDVSQFYRNATRISRIDDLGPALTIKLMTLLSE
ncbi:MAG: cobaltochelatase subunit CobT [Vicinamibacterales bacterium]